MRGITIEHCIIENKIEKVKELLAYHQLSLTKIPSKVHYSSIGHLASQFKKVIGVTASQFKKQEYKGRISLRRFGVTAKLISAKTITRSFVTFVENCNYLFDW